MLLIGATVFCSKNCSKIFTYTYLNLQEHLVQRCTHDYFATLLPISLGTYDYFATYLPMSSCGRLSVMANTFYSIDLRQLLLQADPSNSEKRSV